jgi:hypothetical protein
MIVKGFHSIANNPDLPAAAITQRRVCYRFFERGELRKVYNDLTFGASYRDDTMERYFSRRLSRLSNLSEGPEAD